MNLVLVLGLLGLTALFVSRAIRSFIRNRVWLDPVVDKVTMYTDPNVSVHAGVSLFGFLCLLQGYLVAVTVVYAIVFFVPLLWHTLGNTKPAYTEAID